MSTEKKPIKRISIEEKSIKFLLRALFWFFCLYTIGSVLWYTFVPTPAEFVGGFPDSLEPNSWKSVVRHFVLFPEHISIPVLLDFVNLAFLTIFVSKMRKDITKSIDEDRELGVQKYAQWAMGSLISGIIFLSSRVVLESRDERVVVYLAAVIIFSAVSYLILQRFPPEDGPSKKARALANGLPESSGVRREPNRYDLSLS